MKQLLKENGFPTKYGYACGYGKEDWSEDKKRRKTIFEDGSHNCIDVKWEDESGYHWEQFFYMDGAGAAKKAEKLYKSIKM